MPRLTIISFVLATTISSLVQADEKDDAKRRQIEILKSIRGNFIVRRNADGHATQFSNGVSIISDEQLNRLASLPYLEELSISGSYNTDEGVTHLAASTSLKHLRLFLTSVTDEGMKCLGRMIGLESLELSYRKPQTSLSDDGVAQIKNLTNLKRLILGNTEITDQGLVHLKGMSRLNVLYLLGCSVTGSGLRELQHLPLASLGLWDTSLNEDGLAEVGKFPDLIALHVGLNKSFTGKRLEHLKSLRKLQLLSLYQSDVDDEGLSHLREMVELNHLDLQYTKVTDAGLDHLLHLGKLTVVNLYGTAVTEEGVKKLQQAHGKRLLIGWSGGRGQ